MKGKLVLVPNTLDLGTDCEVDLREVLPQAVIERAAKLAYWATENAKTTRALLKRVDRLVPLALPLQQIHITELPRPAKGGAVARGASPDLKPLLAPALAGHDLGLLSEAGLPAVADPGAALVQAAHAMGIVVEPLAGPSSLLLALAACAGRCALRRARPSPPPPPLPLGLRQCHAPVAVMPAGLAWM
jgi:16S rRNA (cytidine1402-2'-O)-methyltransferase